MGHGLQKAFAAARATNLEPGVVTDEMRKFLVALKVAGGSANGRRARMPLATREQDRARQKCKRLGLAYYSGGEWHITDAGRAAA